MYYSVDFPLVPTLREWYQDTLIDIKAKQGVLLVYIIGQCFNPIRTGLLEINEN